MRTDLRCVKEKRLEEEVSVASAPECGEARMKEVARIKCDGTQTRSRKEDRCVERRKRRKRRK
jgi:hypothetical protein